MTSSNITDGRQPVEFQTLVESIRSVDERLKIRAARAVNASLTLRNWLIGFYIQECEQVGSDRAEYGDRLIETLAAELQQKGVSRSEPRELRRYRLFYQRYPQIRESLTPEFRNLLTGKDLSDRSIAGSAAILPARTWPRFLLRGSTATHPNR